MRSPILALAATAFLSSAAFAQDTQTGSHNPAIKDNAPHTVAAPAEGANSFTEDQARGRFAKAGYTDLGALTKTDGMWIATAKKGGKSATVMLDYKGNITSK